jgi:F-type H+-transporting ATPase subunit a
VCTGWPGRVGVAGEAPTRRQQMSWLLAESGPNVSLVAEKLFNIGPLNVTNSMLLGLVGTALVIWLLLYTKRHAESGKHTRLSVAILWMYDVLLGTVEEVMGDRAKARKLAPLAITMFFIIMLNNWLEILPFVGPLTYHGLPFFRGLAADLNFTASLAIITMVTAQIWAVRHLGFFGNLGRYFGNPLKDPMHTMEGFLELIAEFSRLIALAMRLFGNIFGGEVLLLVMGFITSYAAPIALPPFMLLELFVGAIQAYVFFMLTVVFVSLGSAGHSPDAPDLQTHPRAEPGAISGEPGAVSS